MMTSEGIDALVRLMPWAFDAEELTRVSKKLRPQLPRVDTGRNVLEFAERYASLVGEKYYSAPHLELIAKRLGESRRLLIVLPYRSGKSQLVARWYPLWLLLTHGGIRVLLTAHTYELATDHSRWIQRALQEMEYPLGQAREHRLRLGNGSELMAIGMGGPLVGRGADVLIIDDPVKSAEQVGTLHARDKAMQWLQTLALSRLSPQGQAIVCMTRWHEDDMAGRLAQSPDWETLVIPAQAEEDDSLGREPGEYLSLPWVPDHELAEYWEERRRDAGERVWATAYQCRPVPLEGAYFRSADLDHIADPDVLEQIRRVVIAVDPAVSTESSADRAAIAVVGEWGDKAVVLAVYAGRWGWDGLIDRIEQAYRQWGGTLYIEAQGVQTALLQVLARRGIRALPVVAKTAKTQRAAVLQLYAEQGRLLFARSMPGYAETKDELLKFPLGSHDDIVDALAYAVGELSRPKAKVYRLA